MGGVRAGMCADDSKKNQKQDNSKKKLAEGRGDCVSVKMTPACASARLAEYTELRKPATTGPALTSTRCCSVRRSPLPAAANSFSRPRRCHSSMASDLWTRPRFFCFTRAIAAAISASCPACKSALRSSSSRRCLARSIAARRAISLSEPPSSTCWYRSPSCACFLSCAATRFFSLKPESVGKSTIRFVTPALALRER